MPLPLATSLLVALALVPMRHEPPPPGNPLKGFMPYVGEHAFPHSMEYTYFGFGDVHPAPGVFALDVVVEPVLRDVASRGNQLVLRVFLDYPDHRLSVPEYLLDAGLRLEPYTDHGGGRSPDYDDPRLVDAMEALIAAMGERLDGDPRVAFVQVGLLGHWGEWHTWPRTELFPSVATQERVLAAFDAAFDETPILVSQDAMGHEPMARLREFHVGFHDDAFLEGTLGPAEWMFAPRLGRLGLGERWREAPIGGEVLPSHQRAMWDLPSGAPQDFEACVRATRASWLLNHGLFTREWTDEQRERAIVAEALLGYELHVARALASLEGEALEATVVVENRGVAPFYLRWPVELALLGEDESVLARFGTPWDVRSVLPGEPASWTIRLEAPFTEEPPLAIGLRVANPLPGGKVVRFANQEMGREWLLLPFTTDRDADEATRTPRP